MTAPAASAPVSISARGWGWRHGGRAAWALAELDLEIGPGERVLLLGPSGSGKSTLLAALAGVLGGDDDGERRGSLTLDGRDPRAARGRAGLVLQDPETQVILPRVGDDVAFGCENIGVPRQQIPGRVAEALETVGLRVALSGLTGALSGGQKQRLALAGVLAMRPGLLLLDEPTGQLDPEGAASVRAAVARAAERTGATVVVVEHRVAPWLEIVDRVVVLGATGAVRADGPATAVLAAQGESLARQGVWVPGHDPQVGAPRAVDAPPLLEADRLVIGRDARPVRTIDGLTIAPGVLTTLEGANGSGKTTLALTLGGLIPPVGGRLAATAPLRGDLAAEPVRWRSRDLLTRIGSVFQSPQHQFIRPTVRDELAVGPRALRLPEAAVLARVTELLERLGLQRLADANPFTLSGGQQRRLSVGGVLAAAPRVVVLDEPTFGQDALTWASLVGLLVDTVESGTAVVAATHDAGLQALAGQVVRLGDRVEAAA